MVSEEFRQNVESGNVMTVRSALSDYLVIDTTFQKFCEALAYAERFMEVIENENGQDEYDEDPENWDELYINSQLVSLMMNFSQKRIDHIQRVISKVWGAEVKHTDTLEMGKDTENKTRTYGSKNQNISNSKEERTGKKTIKEERGDVKRIEEEIHPIDIAAWMIGGGIAMGVIGGIVYGIGSVVAEPVIAHAGLVVAKVGGGVTIAGGVIKIVKK